MEWGYIYSSDFEVHERNTEKMSKRIWVLICLGAVMGQAAWAEGIRFERRVLNADSPFEACSVFDVDGDGDLDVMCGDSWYEAPEYTRHKIREIKMQDEYAYDFANIPMDVDKDGRLDVVTVTWHSQAVLWYRNPGPEGGMWEEFEVDRPGNMETAIEADIDNDGVMDILPNVAQKTIWYRLVGPKKFERMDVLPTGTHGLGAGDLNGDGRPDLVLPNAWLEQKADGSWVEHSEFELGQMSIPALVHDVDGDGDGDIIWGMAHAYGVYWLEQQKADDGARVWVKHEIDSDWSQAHYLLLADLTGDGRKELVTGKRYRAHNGNDPGGDEPRVIYYYQWDAASKEWTRYPIQEEGPAGFGIYAWTADLDGDGRIDLVTPGKSGLYWWKNLGE